MKKKNSQQSRGGRSTNEHAAATSSKNTPQYEVFDKFEALSLRDYISLSDQPRSDVASRKKYQEQASAANVVSGKRQPKKTSRNSRDKKRGNNKNVFGGKQLKKAVVVEISEGTTLNRKNKTKNLSENELVAAAQYVENISDNVQYGSYDGLYHDGSYDGIYPEHYYYDLGYDYFQDSGYYQYFYPAHEMTYSYHYQYAPLAAAPLPAPHALNIHAPAFEPTTGQHR